MKKLMFVLCLALVIDAEAQVSINTDGTPADNSAMLDVKTTSRGILIPRMTLSQRNAIPSPANGLMIYQTDNTPGFYYNSGTSGIPAWTKVGTGSNWSITGNSGTTNGANFIGTTDDVALTFRVNNMLSGKLDPDLYNTSFGIGALTSGSTGSYNTALGSYSLSNNSSGGFNTALGTFALFTQSYNPGYTWQSDNVAVGYSSLYYNQSTTGANGIRNTALGSQALLHNTTGNENTATGAFTMFNNLNGSGNTAAGSHAMHDNKTASANVAIGDWALYSQSYNPGDEWPSNNVAVGHEALYYNQPNSTTNGINNTALGKSAMFHNTTGRYNTSTGSYSLYSNLTGSSNTAAGNSVLFDNTTGNENTAIGTDAMSNNTSASDNIAIGNQALGLQSYNPGNSWESDNVAIGVAALNHNQPTSTSNGKQNVAVGNYSLWNNTTGHNNTANGFQALYFNTTACYNIAVGNYALYTQTYDGSGSAWACHNVAVGYQALYSNQPTLTTNGYHNTALGSLSMGDNTIGNDNTAGGYMALNNNTSGINNTALGAYSLTTNTIGGGNTAIGHNAGPNGNNYVNTTCLGNLTAATGPNMVRIGNVYVGSIGGYQDWSNISDARFKENVKEDVPGLSFISQLRPVTYQLNREEINEFTGINERRAKIREQEPNAAFLTGEKYSPVTTGFLAQEVEAAAKSIGFDFSGVDAPKNENDMYSLRYAAFVVPLVKAVQEQQQEIDQLKTENAMLQERISAIESRLSIK
jgi:trimeric autotransporter adhesin